MNSIMNAWTLFCMIYFGFNVIFTVICLSVEQPFLYDQTKWQRINQIVRMLFLGCFYALFAIVIFSVDMTKQSRKERQECKENKQNEIEKGQEDD